MLLPSVSICSTLKGYNCIIYIFFTHPEVSNMFFSCFNMIHDADFFSMFHSFQALKVSVYLLSEASQLIFIHVPGPQHSSNIFSTSHHLPPSFPVLPLPSHAHCCFYVTCKVSILLYFSVCCCILLIICDVGVVVPLVSPRYA